MLHLRAVAVCLVLLPCACGALPASRPPLSISSPRLDSGVRGSGGDGLGGESVVGKPEGAAGVVNRVTAP